MYEKSSVGETKPGKPDAPAGYLKPKLAKLVFSDKMPLFVHQILLLVFLMCMSLSLASFMCLTLPGEWWTNLYTLIYMALQETVKTQ